MNHNFKLKPSETSVTNDAELLNYALKSARENAVRQPEKESYFSSCCSSGLLLVIRCRRCRTTRCPRCPPLLPYF